MGGFGDAFAWQNTLQRAAPLILTGLAVALPAQAGRVIIGAEGALVLGGLAAAALGLRAVGAGAAVGGVAADGAGRHADGRPVDRHRRLAAREARGQRDHRQPADELHRHRAVQPDGRDRAARPGQPEQAVDQAAGRQLPAAGDAGAGRALGPGRGHRRCAHRLGGGQAHAAGPGAARGRRQPAHRARRRPAGDLADHRRLRRRRRLRRAWPARWRWRRCTARPMRR